MTIAEAIQHPTARLILLAEIQAGKWLRTWVAAGYEYVWQCPLKDIPAAVTVNGVVLNRRNGVLDVEADFDTWFADGENLYISHLDAETEQPFNPFASVILASIPFYLANTARVYNDRFYEPLLSSAPNIQLRIERIFGGIDQIGGGTMEFLNNGFFDAYRDLQWDNGSVVLKLGVDVPPDKVMAYSDFHTLGTWNVDEWDIDTQTFTLKLVEPKNRLTLQIPIDTYDRAAFPNIVDQQVGKPIQIAFGAILGATPAIIDKAAKKFKVAGHSIASFDGVRVRNSGTGNAPWVTSAFVTKNTADATFTLGADFTGDEDVSVDFTGKVDGGGVVIANAVDIVQDILALVGETNLNAASFTTARNRLDAGVDNFGNRITLRAPSLYLDSQESALNVIGGILAAVGMYLFTDASGQYFIGVFEPQTGEGLPTFSDTDVLAFKEENFLVDQAQTISRSTAEYAIRAADRFSQFYTFDNPSIQSVHGFAAPVLKNTQLPFASTADAQYYAQRDLVMLGLPRKVYTVQIPWQAITLLPGNQVLLQYTRKNIFAVLEVLEVSLDLNLKNVSLTLGNLRGWNDQPGFWIDDVAALPTRFAGLAGYGSGSLTWNKDWDAQIKTWARQNVGYWADENGFADPTDPDSFIASAWF